MTLIDITLPISPQLPVYPGDPAIEMALEADITRGDAYNLTRLSLSAHTGTHLDAPRHFIADGPTIDELALDALVGPALVVETDAPCDLTADDLDRLDIPLDIQRLLLKTRNSRRWEQPMTPVFAPDFIALKPSAAEWLIRRGVRLVGVDYLSVEALDAAPDSPVHTSLLRAGVLILEGLNLSGVTPGTYNLIALPMKLVGADGAPTRAVLVTVAGVVAQP